MYIPTTAHFQILFQTAATTRPASLECWTPKLSGLLWRNGCLVMLYKTSKDLVQCPINKSKLQEASTCQRRCHEQKLQQITTRTKYRVGFFLPPTIKDWSITKRSSSNGSFCRNLWILSSPGLPLTKSSSLVTNTAVFYWLLFWTCTYLRYWKSTWAQGHDNQLNDFRRLLQ